MSEENEAASAAALATPGGSNTNPTGQPILRRSKFPRATPILTSHSTGIARIRRLSGHFSSGVATNQNPNNDETTNSTANLNTEVRSTPPSTPLIHHHHQHHHQMSPLVIHNENSNSSQHSLPFTRLQSIIKSPGSHAVSPLVSKLHLSQPSASGVSYDSSDLYLNSNPSTPIPQNSITFRQYLTANSNMSGFSSVPMSPATTHILQQQPTTPGGSIYNPKFSAEHIMNIIKYKALQKLKKIESDSLKEKRKKNQIKQLRVDETAATASALNPAVLDRSKIRMRDLLYYNAKSSSSINTNKKTASPTDPDEVIIEDGNATSGLNDEIILPDANNSLDINDESLGGASGDRSLSNDSLNSEVYPKDSNYGSRPAALPHPVIASQSAPQLKFAEDGSIIINEESLIIQRIEVEPQYDITVVEESENLDNLNYNSYRKFHHTKKWTKRETAKFYKALSMIGTDFTMIQRLFSHRNRDEIKRKFKREEKLNQALIDKILSTTTKIDLSVFVSASSEDETPTTAENADEAETNPEEHSANQQNPIDPTKKLTKKKTKPRRIKKRAFIESDDEDPSIVQQATTSSSTAANGEEFPFKKKQNYRRIAKKNEPAADTATATATDPDTPKDETLSLLTAVHENIMEKIQNQQKDKEEEADTEAKKEEKKEVEEEEEEENIVLDLDTNQITSNKSVLMDINFNSKLEREEKLEKKEEDDQEDEEIILDLDNNTIITNNKKTILNVHYEQDPSVPLSSSSLPHSETSKVNNLSETTSQIPSQAPTPTATTTSKSRITITKIPRT